MEFTDDYIQKYIGLILSIVARHSKNSLTDHYDLLQSGYIGLAKALQTYDKSKGKESSYVYLCVRSEVIKARYYKNKEYKDLANGEDSFFNEIEVDDNNCPSYNIENIESNQDKKKEIRRIKNILYRHFKKDDSLNRRIFFDRILKGMAIKDMIKKYNLSYFAIYNRVRLTSKKIKGIIEKGDKK